MTAKAYRIEWRPTARNDLRTIVRYIGKDNPVHAENFGQEIRDQTKPLAQHPELGRTGRPGSSADVRELVAHPNYIVFYRVLVEARTVQILSVKHAAQQTP
ncbi:type II toxin-antitoxin system RelE/ParE family toxin [Candidatus Thiosymbion oneisti]|uniref:type II toxin-antitoxin system RelE/ParE family toxin n=1 Tax=Candidatus Thiosymbion oneisti TaxID=589554 RepID=UPI000A6B9D3B|nr:type II toxin-antitoxin system RelE/ParE family toxin [Candidatus Thiosymbion oneisti]